MQRICNWLVVALSKSETTLTNYQLPHIIQYSQIKSRECQPSFKYNFDRKNFVSIFFLSFFFKQIFEFELIHSTIKPI